MNGNTGGSNLGSTKIKMSICTIYLYMDHKSSDALLGSRGVYACARISTVRMDGPWRKVPRCEAACAICARKDWLKHRFKLRLFVEPPAGSISEDTVAEPVPEQEDADEQEDAGRRQYYIQSPDLVHKLLDVNRYAQRWPLIPTSGGATRIKHRTSQPQGQ